jgi:YggT family protein
VNIVGDVLSALLYLFLLFLLGRLVLDYVRQFARSWHPSGVVLVLAEVTYTVTEPPLKLLRRFIPNLRLGSLAFDLSFMVLFLVVLIMITFVQTI